MRIAESPSPSNRCGFNTDRCRKWDSRFQDAAEAEKRSRGRGWDETEAKDGISTAPSLSVTQEVAAMKNTWSTTVAVTAMQTYPIMRMRTRP